MRLLRLKVLYVSIRSLLPAAVERPDDGRWDGLLAAKRAMLAAADRMEAQLIAASKHLSTLSDQAREDFLRQLFGSSEPSAG